MKLFYIVSLLILAASASSVMALNNEWLGFGSGADLWSNGDNWSAFFPPRTTEDALIDVADANYTCFIDSSVTNAVAHTVYVGFYRPAYLNGIS